MARKKSDPKTWHQKFRECVKEITPDNEESPLARLTRAGCDEQLVTSFLMVVTLKRMSELPTWDKGKRLQVKSLRLAEKLKLDSEEIRTTNLEIGQSNPIFQEVPDLLEAYAEMLIATFCPSTFGSLKTTMVNWHLVALSLYVEGKTGEFHDGELASLLDAASSANGAELPDATSADAIRKKRDYFRRRRPTLYASLARRFSSSR